MATISEISPYGPDSFFENVEDNSSLIELWTGVSIEKIGQAHDKALCLVSL